MKYQKIKNLLADTTNQPSKYKTLTWFEINDESKRRYDNSNIRFKTSIISSNLCDYKDGYILIKGTIIARSTAAAGESVRNANRRFIFKNCAPFTDSITEINKTQVDDAQNT